MLILGVVPFALIGGICFLYVLNYNLSVAVAVGFIALLGVAVELCVVMLTFLNLAWRDRLTSVKSQNRTPTLEDLRECVLDGARFRLRPIMMTTLTIILGLLPIMLGTGTGSEVMRRIAAPMVGGMISATVLALVVLPAVFFVWKRISDLNEGAART